MHENVTNVENLLVEALVDGKLMMLPAENTSTKTLCFDCRGMGAPCGREDRQRFGTHPSCLKAYTTDPTMKGHVEQLRREIEICKKSNTASIRLIVFDKRGRWAAMAVGKAFAEVLAGFRALP